MKPISKHEFYFDLPEEKVARFPLEKRDDSKLLVYKNSEVMDLSFKDLAGQFSGDELLVFNNAKVIPARLYFRRQTGALIEVLLLEPVAPASYDQVFQSTKKCTWKCMVGNSKKWREDEDVYFENEEVTLIARWSDKDKRFVELEWESDAAFTDLLDEIGQLPLPPYLNRGVEEADYANYQTMFAENLGSVAAPTAGLHFTEERIQELKDKGVGMCGVTLHVGAGTFLPVKEENALDHEMHREHFEITKASLQALIDTSKRVAVGTTSLRVLESLYWMGVRFASGSVAENTLKLEPYEVGTTMTYKDALNVLLAYMESESKEVLRGSTEIMILPSYQPKSIVALMTNFHLPESTLLFLVSSVVGDKWREIYEHALKKGYRFLSYGDASMLFL